MERTDFIENRIDVIKNIYTLYSYAKSFAASEREWALQRFKKGKWYVVEPFGNTLLFAPSRFVGYKNNTMEKHISNQGDGTQTNNRFRELKLYKEIVDYNLLEQFKRFMITLGIEKDTANFFIPYELDISNLQNQHKCYFICPTHCKGQKQNAWKNFLSKNIMAIGWDHKDYTNYTIDEIKQEYINDPTAIGPFTLIKQIKAGDIICCTNNNFGLWGIGIALSQYKYKNKIHYAGVTDDGSESYYSHYVDVAWLSFKEQGYISVPEFNIQSAEKQWQPYGTLNQRDDIPEYITNYLLYKNHINMEDNKYEKYIKLLEANKNIIFTGAPGTGKTYLAKKIAEAMDAEYEFVQFHPSYDYTDFVEGLRPTPPDNNGNIGFKRVDGVFKNFCKRAITDSVNEEYLCSEVTLFEKCYYDLIADIRNGKIEYIQLKQKMSTKLSVTPTNSIKWQNSSENISINAVSLNRLLKLYSVFNTLQEVEDMKNIDFTIRDIIGGANTTYFWGVLREVLRRKEEYSSPMLQINIDNNLIRKYIKSGMEITSSKGRSKYHIANLDDTTIVLNGETIQGYKIPFTDVIKAYKNMLWEGGQKNGNDAYTAALAKYIYEQLIIENKNIENKNNKIVKREIKTDNNKYLFIIDEINRGEISKIFGELFFSIDPGYRGKKGRVKTQYQNMITEEGDPFYEGFYVPENVYIIGTMNDIDRSVESMDFAIRRRFAWEEIKANENIGMLDELQEMKSEVVDTMKRLNAAIWDEDTSTGIEGMNAAYHIGGAYFHKIQLYINEDHSNKNAAYRHLWENHLKGVLFEYLRGTPNTTANLKKLESVYYNKNGNNDI